MGISQDCACALKKMVRESGSGLAAHPSHFAANPNSVATGGMADVDECTLLLLPQRRKAPTPQAVLNELATLVPSW